MTFSSLAPHHKRSTPEPELELELEPAFEPKTTFHPTRSQSGDHCLRPDSPMERRSQSPRLKRSCSPRVRRCRAANSSRLSSNVVGYLTSTLDLPSSPEPSESRKGTFTHIQAIDAFAVRSPSSANSFTLKQEWAKLRGSVGLPDSPSTSFWAMSPGPVISPQSASAAETPPTSGRDEDFAFVEGDSTSRGSNLYGEVWHILASTSLDDDGEGERSGAVQEDRTSPVNPQSRKPTMLGRRTNSDVASKLQALKLRAVSPRRASPTRKQVSPTRRSPSKRSSPTRARSRVSSSTAQRKDSSAGQRMRRPPTWHSAWSSVSKMETDEAEGVQEGIPPSLVRKGPKVPVMKLQSSFDIDLSATRQGPRSVSNIGVIQPWPERDESEFARGKPLLKSLELDPISFDPEQLCHLALELFVELELPEKCKIPVEKIQRFILAVKDRMFPNPYHNWIHVFDVTQTVYALASTTGLLAKLDHWDRFALLCAALCHDLEHPGVNNMFLSKSKSALANQYRDKVLEKHHSLRAFELMVDGEVDLLRGLNTTKYYDFRKRVTNTILATDMAKHGDYVAKLQNILAGTEENTTQFELDLIMKCADTSNVLKPFSVAKKWAMRVTDEFFLQGDMERESGMDVTPMCDRHSQTRVGSQKGFIDFVMKPFYESVQRLYPQMERHVQQMHRNREEWDEWDDDRLTRDLGCDF